MVGRFVTREDFDWLLAFFRLPLWMRDDESSSSRSDTLSGLAKMLRISLASSSSSSSEVGVESGGGVSSSLGFLWKLLYRASAICLRVPSARE